MGRQSDQDRVVCGKPCFGLVKPRPTIVGVDSERLAPETDKRHAAQTVTQAGEELAMSLQFEVEAIAKRHGYPQQKDGLP